MSGRKNGDNPETLFAFELLVEHVRIEKESKVSGELALGVRLLDFPTLLIYQQPQAQRGEHAFNRGKSCLFKMTLNALHTHLSRTPLYAMVLDVKEEVPKLVGTSLISLAKATGRIRRDVAEHGASAPSSHGERGLVGLCNLTGERVGFIALSYKLLSLGASLLPHIAERSGLKSTNGGQYVQESNISTELLPLDCGNVHSPALDKSDAGRNTPNDKPTSENASINEDKQDRGVRVDVRTEHKPRSQTPQTLKETDNSFEGDLTVFCPPRLFYSNSEEKSKSEGGGCTLRRLGSEAFTFEGASSEEETAENEIAGSPMMHDVKTSGNQETSGVAANVLGEALRQLPLLNALLVELSQLNGQSPHEPLSIHPSLAWIYRPASTEPSTGRGNSARKGQSKSLQKARRGASPHLKHFHSPRNCSTPSVRPASVKVKDKQGGDVIESKSSCTSPRKKLVYGTTKTFNLRLKQISPLKVKRRECMELIQNDTQASAAKGKTKSGNKIMKSSKRKSVLNQSASLNENIETVIQNITVDSARQETVALKQKNLHGEVHKQDRKEEKPSLSERDLKYIHMPGVDGGKDKNEHRSESNRSQADRRGEKTESPGSSGHSSPKSSLSHSSGGGSEEADYADDFNSLEPSDAYSPDPASSPEPSRAKTPRSPVRPDFCGSDSGSEGFRKRAALPVPVKAPSSPQRALRGTHVIRPRTHASALSFSSSDGDRDGSASLQTVRSVRQMTDSSRVERSSGADSFTSRGQRSRSTKSGGPVGGFSAESLSSFEPQEAEELEDELGSLDFRKEYQHISKLVSSKLPGYTM